VQGIVFTEFLDMVEDRFTPEVADRMITAAAVPSDGAYTIHVEVRKLYPDAELPTFTCDTSTPGRLTMLYRSSRPFADLAEGLIAGCIAHFCE